MTAVELEHSKTSSLPNIPRSNDLATDWRVSQETMKKEDDLKNRTYEEFCKSAYLPLYIECFRRGWTTEKLEQACDWAILTWQYDGFTGKPPLKLVLEAILAVSQ